MLFFCVKCDLIDFRKSNQYVQWLQSAFSSWSSQTQLVYLICNCMGERGGVFAEARNSLNTSLLRAVWLSRYTQLYATGKLWVCAWWLWVHITLIHSTAQINYIFDTGVPPFIVTSSMDQSGLTYRWSLQTLFYISAHLLVVSLI